MTVIAFPAKEPVLPEVDMEAIRARVNRLDKDQLAIWAVECWAAARACGDADVAASALYTAAMCAMRIADERVWERRKSRLSRLKRRNLLGDAVLQTG